MELGAVTCLPGEPKCDICPSFFLLHAGYAKGIAAKLPLKQKKPPRKIMEKTVFVLTAADRLALICRPEGGLLAGLWGLPSADGALTPDEAKKELERQRDPCGKPHPSSAGKTHLHTCGMAHAGIRRKAFRHPGKLRLYLGIRVGT